MTAALAAAGSEAPELVELDSGASGMSAGLVRGSRRELEHDVMTIEEASSNAIVNGFGKLWEPVVRGKEDVVIDEGLSVGCWCGHPVMLCVVR